MLELGINIDHIATIRQARRTYEPDPVWAAAEAELGGADTITIHLREDRRHINDRDVELLRQTVQSKLNLEMSLAEEIVQIVVKAKPDQATLVPEKREEITTEGGLDLLREPARVADVVKRLQDQNIFASAFIDPDEKQIQAAQDMGFEAVELHTGEYANAKDDALIDQLHRLQRAGDLVRERGMRLHAGHGLNYRNVIPVARIPCMAELNIGHSIISRAVFVGLREAVREMKRVIENATLPRDVYTVQPERPLTGVLNYRGGPPHV